MIHNDSLCNLEIAYCVNMTTLGLPCQDEFWHYKGGSGK